MASGAPAAIASFALLHAFSASRQASFAGLPPDPRSSPSAHVKSCTYHRWFSRPMGCKSASYWNIPMGTAKLQRLFRFRMGCHRLPIEQGRHLRLPRARRVCRLCSTGQLGDERHMLLECPALSDVRAAFSELISQSSGVMARLVWAKDQARVGRYITACLNRMQCG